MRIGKKAKDQEPKSQAMEGINRLICTSKTQTHPLTGMFGRVKVASPASLLGNKRVYCNYTVSVVEMAWLIFVCLMLVSLSLLNNWNCGKHQFVWLPCININEYLLNSRNHSMQAISMFVFNENMVKREVKISAGRSQYDLAEQFGIGFCIGFWRKKLNSFIQLKLGRAVTAVNVLWSPI